MKRLTMNRLALSGIRTSKKDYFLLGISAFLAIFAAVSTVLGTLALMQAATDRRNEAYGSEDAFVFDVQSVPENIPGVRQYGCVTVLGQVKDFPVGYYDDAARRLVVGQHLFGVWRYLQYNWWEIRINAITSLMTAAVLTGLCYLVIRRQVKKMLESSIVESIREE